MSEEREFLHDISTPLTALQFNIENVICTLGDRKPEEIDECLRLLNSCLAQLKKATEMIHGRRAALMKEGNR